MNNKDIVKIIASDFKNTRFIDTHDCAFARAIKRAFNLKDVNIGPMEASDCSTNNCSIKDFITFYYGEDFYSEDLKKAIKLNFDDTVIREVEVTILNPNYKIV